jgi:hypothetical protein
VSFTHAFRHAIEPHAKGAQSFTMFGGHVVEEPVQAVGSVSLPPVHEASAPHGMPELPAG